MCGQNAVIVLARIHLGGEGGGGVSRDDCRCFRRVISACLPNIEAVSCLPVSYKAAVVEHGFFGDISLVSKSLRLEFSIDGL